MVAGTLLNFSLHVPATLLIARYDADGVLDPSFATDGKAEYRIDDANVSAADAALQADGKIVVAAGSSHGLVRFHADGTLDQGFGTNGISSSRTDFRQSAVLLQTDGKIIVTGDVPNTTTGRSDFALLRLHQDGTLDSGFGADGRAVFAINAGGTNYAVTSAGAIQPDGKILLTGYFGYYFTDSHEKIAIIRVVAPGGSRRRTLRR